MNDVLKLQMQATLDAGDSGIEEDAPISTLSWSHCSNEN
jgi:hypothetical protein